MYAYDLLRYIHMKIEEKYKNYRMAFRKFDCNYDGSLSFPEFMTGLEVLGIRYSLKDFRKVYDFIDYNQENQIDFNKFCMMNTDKIKMKNWKKILREKVFDPNCFSTTMGTAKPPKAPTIPD